jgi:outer membrane protein TolC
VRIHVMVLGLALGVVSPLAAQNTPERVPFERLWKGIATNAPALQAADEEALAAKAAAGRAKSHWAPRVYLDARAYRSDDPAMSFMSLLESREVESSDFAPSSLNHPVEKTYGQETLGVDWALFEGGARKAGADAASKIHQAKSYEATAIRSGLYAKTAGTYAALMSLEKEAADLGRLQSTVREMLDKYFIGAKSNPVGYSGLLGLKTLLNRLEGLQAEISAKKNSLQGDLTLQAGVLPKDWAIVPGPVVPFLDQALPMPSQMTSPGSVLAAQAGAEAMEKMRGVETARFLPRVALFAQGSLNQGERAASHGYTAGAYLQWNLFEAGSFKAKEEAARRAKAAKAQAEALTLQTASDRVRATETLKALQTNMVLLDESEKLMEEQTRTAQTLFKNGSINALQMVEVFSRRADLVDQKARVEMEYAQAKALAVIQSGFEESSHDEQ